MDKHTFKVLEYNLVIEKIAGKTTCIYGRQTVLCRMPQKEIESIERLQEQTREALSILDSTEPLSVGEMDPVDKLLEMASKEIPLQGSDIRRVYQTLERSSELKGYLDKREAILPEIYRDSLALTAFPALEREIVQKVGSDGRILDRASSELARLRREDEVLQGRIRGHLEGFLKNPDYLKMLQEPIITSREHRHVLPVKQEYRSQFPGIALDSSASGATVFMEPLSVLKLTNELKYVRNQEIREEEKIRLDLTRRISCCREDLLRNLEFIGHYDALQAAARYIIDSDCIIPKVVKDPVLNLKSARHPLLEVKPVPVDIRVGEDFAGLVITGPNTGGKTVTLKTAGLLTMMALAGLPVPAGEGSVVGLFSGIYADIGDEQSISQNLSTFSAHMANIVQLLPRSGKRTLVLLDEIGAGTDPSEGVALGSAILKYLTDRGSRVIATTHYNELKIFASRNSEFVNAAVEFDEETLMPTYRLQIGLPGRSCAIRIARRLGVPQKIINIASNSMGGIHHKVDSLLSEIDRQKALTRDELEQAREQREQMEILRDEYDMRIEELEAEKDEILQQATKEMDLVFQEVFRELRQARAQWRASIKDFREGRQDRAGVQQKERKVKSLLDRTIEKLQGMRRDKKQPSAPVPPRGKFFEDQPVKITTTGRRGRIDRMLDEATALVQIDNIRMEIPLSDMEPVLLELPGEDVGISSLRFEKAVNISDQLDIRGLTVDEGVIRLEKYLDDACLASLDSFRIVHGKGTGALRQGIRDYLKSSRVVKGFREGDIHEGGWGVTVVNL